MTENNEGFANQGNEWELWGVYLLCCGPSNWVASVDGVRGYGTTPLLALRDLLTYCTDVAAQHRAKARRLDAVADVVAMVEAR